jgi:hypothetical protein
MNTARFTTSARNLIMALVGSARIAAAQAQTQADSVMVERVTARWTTGSINVQLGAARLGLAELNQSLAANGRPAFSTNVATIGVSGYARFGRMLVGVGGESALPQRELSSGWVSKISFGSATLDAGFALIDRRHLLVYPQLSLGLRKTSLRMERSGDFTYDAGMQDPARGVALSTRSALAGFGLVAESHLSTRRTGAFSIGLRAGVVQPLGSPATSAGESAVTGTPRENAGRYLRLSVGKPIGKRGDVISALSTALLSIITGG